MSRIRSMALAAAVVMTATLGLAPHAAQADSTSLTYNGGPVITAPKVYIDFWGAEWSSSFPSPGPTSPTVQNYIKSYFTNVGGSDWMSSLTQYYWVDQNANRTFITNPTSQLKGVWSDARALPASFDKAAVLGEALNYAVPYFNDIGDDNAVYFILTGPNRVPSDMGPNCGYHDRLAYNGHQYAFAYVSYQPTTPGGCYVNQVNSGDDAFGHGILDGYSITGGHEYAEAITDPNFGNGQGWWDHYRCTNGSTDLTKCTPVADWTYDEIGDKCGPAEPNWTPTPNPLFGDVKMGNQYFAAEGLWSNSAGGCSLGPYYQPSASCGSIGASATPSTPALIGSTITIFAAAYNCPIPLYQFWLLPPGSTTWQLVQSYGLSNQFSWISTGLAAGTYTFSVWSRDAASPGVNGNSWDSYTTLTYTLLSVPTPDLVGNATGDFNGDGYADVAVLYNYATNVSGIYVWLGQPDGSLASQGEWWHGSSFDAGHSKIVAGNFNGDAYSDLAVLYNYGTNKTGIWVWYGPRTGFQHPTEPWYGSSFDWGHSKLTASNYNGDSYWDLGVLYDYGGTTTGFWWWPGSAAGITTNVGLVWKYTTFAWAPSKVTSGDYNADGYDDLAILYNYGNSTSGIWVWLGTRNGLQNTTTKWWTGTLDWNASKIISGHWNDAAPVQSPFGYSALSVLYNFGTSTGIYIWQGAVNNAAFKNAKVLWWQKSGYNWGAMKVTGADVNGDGYDDLTVLYSFSFSDTGIYVWKGAAGTGFVDPVKRWESSSFVWAACQIA